MYNHNFLITCVRGSGFEPTTSASAALGFKGAMKAADKSGARYAIVLGETELNSGLVDIKAMESGKVEQVRIAELVKFFN